MYDIIGCQLTRCDERWKEIFEQIFDRLIAWTQAIAAAADIAALHTIQLIFFPSSDCKSVIQVVCATPNAC